MTVLKCPTRAALAAGLATILAATPITAAQAGPGTPGPATPGTARPSGLGSAPGAPGQAAAFAPADKSGFGTAYGPETSRVWFTVQRAGGLGEVYHPDLNTPAVRRLEFVVADGSAAVRVADASTVETVAPDERSLSYRQVNTDRAGRWRLTTRYVTDPGSPSVLVDVDFTALDGQPRRLFVLYDPALGGDSNDDTGQATDDGRALVARDGAVSSTLVARPHFDATSTGYLGTSDGWTDLLPDGQLNQRYRSADTPGTIQQTGELALTGRPGRRHATLSLTFEDGAGPAAAAEHAAEHRRGFERVAGEYARTWHRYLAGLNQPPTSLATAHQRRLYLASAMVLAAGEDKTHRGAFIAAPSMPWHWGTVQPSGPYHLIWSRDLYEIGTALLAVGDRGAAERALDFLFDTQQRPDGSFPQNSDLTGTPVWTGLQLDEVAYPIVLAAQLGRTDPKTWEHVRRAADFLVGFSADGYPAPYSPQERWENQSGYSPATIAAGIAGLVGAAGIARANGAGELADGYLATADQWQRDVEGWTVTRTGTLAPHPYYLRLTKDGKPDAGTTYSIGDSGPSAVDQRSVVDPSFLELVRLGVKSAQDPVIRDSLTVVDRELSYETSRGRFWHRFTFDGYGETADGGPWTLDLPADSQLTRGRGWPIFNGERGEYAIAAGDLTTAGTQLATMAAAAGPGLMIAEQVWDQYPPSGQPGFEPGTGTTSATPLLWSHAQYVRLAVNLAAGSITERPAEVACRYLREC